MNILFYGNGGSGNHGCEAIVRGTVSLLGDNNIYTIQSDSPDEDYHYGLGKLADLRAAKSKQKRDVSFLTAYAKLKLTGNYTDMDGLNYLPGIKSLKGIDLALSVGGDNYCYGNTKIYDYLNQAYHRNGIRTILWGCSIEPEVVEAKDVAQDLQRYEYIVARESITYEAVKAVTERAILAPDPAFFMQPVECRFCGENSEEPLIGINVSPLILHCETEDGIAYENFRHLIKYILRETNAKIVLIPHVVWEHNDDRKVLKTLYHDFGQDERIILIEDHSAPELKYIISKCSFFIGARTHSTIAAYSCGIPTLVVGYSVKAKGIARDLFGTEEGYVLPVQQLRCKDELTKAFCNLYEKRDIIQEYLNGTMLEYLVRGNMAIKLIEEIS